MSCSFSYLNYFSVSLILVCTSPVFILLLSEKRNKSPSIILSDIRNSFCARLMSACASFGKSTISPVMRS